MIKNSHKEYQINHNWFGRPHATHPLIQFTLVSQYAISSLASSFQKLTSMAHKQHLKLHNEMIDAYYIF